MSDFPGINPGGNQNWIEKIITRSHTLAYENRHEYISLEHLALSLLDEPTIQETILQCGAKADLIVATIKSTMEDAPIASVKNRNFDPKPTQSFIQVIQRSIHQAGSAGRVIVEPFHILASLLQESDSFAVYAFEKSGVNRVDFLRALQGGAHGQGTGPEIDPITGQPRVTPDDALKQYCINLNDEAIAGKIDALIGRADEIEKTVTILCRRKKNNPILVGDPGVGKTAIFEGLALRIVNGEVPPYLRDAVIYSLDMGALMAGTKFRGDVEERLKMVLAGIEKVNETKKAILFIDEIHTVIGAGATGGGSMDIGNLLKPALQKGTLRCGGSTTYDEYNKHFRKDGALRRRFGKVDIVEPTISEAKDILRGLAPAYNKFHNIELTDAAIEAAVDLAAKHIHDNKLPDKAIDIIDLAGARQRLVEPEKVEGQSFPVKIIDVEDIEKVVASVARLPDDTVNKDGHGRVKHLESDMKNFVFGQDKAIAELTSAIKLSYAGLREPDKPIGSYLFSGPTGVGKTEVAKQLAKNMGVKLIRFDMSEYMERHSVARLIGAPPGYVGHDDGDGQLIDAIDKNPHAVLLLDEIEKAHPDLFSILLQIMDGAKLTSGRGKTVHFNNVVLILTTNAGAAEMQKDRIGIVLDGDSGKNEDADKEAIKKMFAPEFRNRLDATIGFKTLSPETMIHVVNKFINQLQILLDAKKIIINVSDAAIEWLSKRGYTPEFGARPLARVIQNRIKKPMADEILFGALKDGGKVSVTLVNDKLTLSYLAIEKVDTVTEMS